MTSYSDFDDRRIKHLELIQAVISRLGGNGFLVKGWALTVAGVFFGFSVESSNPLLAAVVVPMTALFWGLDSYFLRSEWLFRELYRQVSELEPTLAPFFMAATGKSFVERAKPRVRSRLAAFWSTTLRTYYGAILVAAALVVLVTVLGSSKA